MNFSPVLFVLALALVSEPGICEPSALARSLLARKSFGLAGGINNLADRQLSTRTASDLNSFVVASIQAATLGQADKQSLFSDFFSLIYRNGAMGDLLKDLFGITPPPVPKCIRNLKIEEFQSIDVSSDGFPSNYPNDQPIDCTYFVTTQSQTATELYINFPDDIKIDSGKSSLKIYDGPTTDSPLLLNADSNGSSQLKTKQPFVTIRFQSEVGAVGFWKITINA